MQRTIALIAAFALIIAMGLNIALGLQNLQLHQQLAARAPVPSAQPNAAQADSAAQLAQQLERSEADRIKATRDATNLRGQLAQLQSAAQERDTLKQQLQSLQQENEQLRNQVGNLQTMNEISSQVVQVRDLAPLGSVPRQFMNYDQLRAYLTDELNQAFSPEAEQRQLAVLRALDMDSGNTDLRKAQIDDSVKNILGFYDHTTKQLVIVTDRPRMGIGDRVTYAHEFTHSLQDQHYNLGQLFARAAGNADYEEAVRALVEGDATLSMGLYARANLSQMDIATYQLEQIQSFDISGLFSTGGGPLVESAAAFPYTDGAAFADMLYQRGGWRALAQAFAKPPRSTEQVLHPQKYLVGDEPVAVRLPNLATRLGGSWRALAEDTLGELYLRIYLERYLPIDQAASGGMGWGGDRYQVLGDDQGRLALALQTAWDGPSDAQEFFDTYRAFVAARAGANATVLRDDQTHLRWQLADRQYYLGRAGNQILVLHAPDGATLDALLRQFQGFA
jgi:hypothetical protein